MFKFLFIFSLVFYLASAQVKEYSTKIQVGEFSDSTSNEPLRGDFIEYDFYYSDTFDFTANTGVQRLKYVITLPSGKTFTELEIYEKQFLKFASCNDSCGWQDLYSYEPMPQLWCPDTGGATADADQNGVAAADLVRFNFGNTNYPNFGTIYCRQDTRRPVYAVIKYTSVPPSYEKRINFIQDAPFNTPVDPSEFAIADKCPAVDPSCFRLDIILVLDWSSSIAQKQAWPDVVDFVLNLLNEINISPQRVNVGIVKFGTTESKIADLNADKNELLDEMDDERSRPPPQPYQNAQYTSIVNGIWLALQELEDNGRDFTKKVVIVISDGDGNRPCCAIDDDEWKDGNHVSGTCCTCRNCGDYDCCKPLHNAHLVQMFNYRHQDWDALGLEWPTFYSVAVGTELDVSTGTQLLITQDQPQNQFRVDGFNNLNTLLYALAQLLGCEVPNSTPCPNNCKPGGFCCGGACECALDCATRPEFNTDCQFGICQVTLEGSQCVATPPDDTKCNDGNDCTHDFCLVNVGCVFDAEGFDNETCDDGNDCTLNEVCINGTCAGQNATDGALCDDKNPCTENVCAAGLCTVSKRKDCPDPVQKDCFISVCKAETGNCEPFPIIEGGQCSEDEDDDECTVWTCDETGTCVEGNRDLDECSGDDNTALIAGLSTAGGVVLCCLAAVAAGLIIFCLAKKASSDVQATIAEFGLNDKVELNPLFLAAGKVKTSGLYQGN